MADFRPVAHGNLPPGLQWSDPKPKTGEPKAEVSYATGGDDCVYRKTCRRSSRGVATTYDMRNPIPKKRH